VRILVTNDDGIYAPGIRTLAEALREMGHEVVVAAPRENWSGRSQAITDGALMAEPVSWPLAGPAWAVDGSPADAVRVAEVLVGYAPDMVVAGINAGPNLGPDVWRSGTVGAAREAVLHGWPALALSSVNGLELDTLRRWLPWLLDVAAAYPYAVVNVNWPPGPPARAVIVPPAWRALKDRPEVMARTAGGSVTVRLVRRVEPPDTLTDVTAVFRGLLAVSILPAVAMEERVLMPAAESRDALPS
jgi:5'/3'-nucleotidase SurE